MKINSIDERMLALEAQANYGLNIYEEEERSQFIIRRKEHSSKSKDKRKSLAQKHSFRRNKHKFMKGIKRFHKSAEGKRFHRKLGNFVAKTAKSEGLLEGFDSSILVALLSLKSHLNIHNSYLCPIAEGNTSWEILFEEANTTLTNVIKKYEDNIQLSENELEIVFNLLLPERIQEIDSSLTSNNKLFKSIYERSAFVLNYLEAIEEVFDNSRIYPRTAIQLMKTINLTPIEVGSFSLDKNNLERLTHKIMKDRSFDVSKYIGFNYILEGELTRVQVIPSQEVSTREAKDGIFKLNDLITKVAR